MLTGKQRSFLKSMANSLDSIIQIGKNGLSESFLEQIDENLESHELVKINLLNNSMLDIDEVSKELTEKTGSEFVQSIGSKIIIYRESQENKKIDLPE